MKLRRILISILLSVMAMQTHVFGTELTRGGKNKPFEARYEFVTSKKLPNGQTSLKTQTGAIYRDSEGRERTESFMEHTSAGIEGKIADIFDPIGNVMYSLDTQSKTVLLKEPLPVAFESSGFWALTLGSETAYAIPKIARPIGNDLGQAEIEELICQGYRKNWSDGGVTEQWYSNELMTLVLAKSINREVECTWRLFNIHRLEPDSKLFVVPADYKEAN